MTNEEVWQALNTELTTDSLSRGYSGMTDEQVMVDINTVYRTQIKDFLTGDEIFTSTDETEFTGLSDANKTLWVSFTSKDSIDPGNSANVAFVNYVFGGGSTTLSNLSTLRLENVSRGQELFGRDIVVGDVQHARRL